jgi:hypothetical protein
LLFKDIATTVAGSMWYRNVILSDICHW